MGIPTDRKADWKAGRSDVPPEVIVTREVRWFRGGSLPHDVLTWFSDGADVYHERRRDRYDPAAANAGIGLKFRGESTFDAKYLMAPETVEELAAGLIGRVGDWVKVSRRSNGSTLLHGDLVSVEKRLRTRTYTFEIPEDGERGIEVGCEVELGDIATPSGPSWSLCFETTGPAEHRDVALRSGVERFLAETPLPGGLVLPVETSCAYPQWLTRRCVAA